MERDDLWAIPTAEVPLASMYRNEILEEADLPLQVHRFYFVLPPRGGSGRARHPRPSAGPRVRQGRALRVFATAEQAQAVHSDMLERATCASRGVSTSSTGCSTCAPGTSASRRRRTFDLEVYAPGSDMWLEVSSVSWCSTTRPGGRTSATAHGRWRSGARTHPERLSPRVAQDLGGACRVRAAGRRVGGAPLGARAVSRNPHDPFAPLTSSTTGVPEHPGVTGATGVP